MKFYEALKECIENGKKIARGDWDSKEAYIWYVPPSCYADVNKDTTYRGHFCLKTAQGDIVSAIVATQTDLTSDEWIVIE